MHRHRSTIKTIFVIKILKAVYIQVLVSRRRRTRWIRWVVINLNISIQAKFMPQLLSQPPTHHIHHLSFSSSHFNRHSMLKGTLGNSIWHLIYLPAFQPFKGHVLRNRISWSLFFGLQAFLPVTNICILNYQRNMSENACKHSFMQLFSHD